VARASRPQLVGTRLFTTRDWPEAGGLKPECRVLCGRVPAMKTIAAVTIGQSPRRARGRGVAVDMRVLLVACVTATTLVLTPSMLHTTAQAPPADLRGARIAVFLDPGFPTIDLAPIPRAEMDTALRDLDVSFLTLDRLISELDIARFEVLVMPYGSAFPKAGWHAIRSFLAAGGNWVNLGGVPFSVPIVHEGGAWREEPRTTAYHKQLSIVHAFPVSARDIVRYQPGPSLSAAESVPDLFRAEEIYTLDMRLTETKDFPSEDGTGGQRDARLQALVLGADRAGVPVAAPFVRVDRLLRDFAGGRWMLARSRAASARA
jgi:hypothetical protein